MDSMSDNGEQEPEFSGARPPVRLLGLDADGMELWESIDGDIWTQPGRRGGRPEGRRGDPAGSGAGEGSCPSNTNPKNRQSDELWSHQEAVCAVDWFEIAGCIQWGEKANETLPQLEAAKQAAQNRLFPELMFSGYRVEMQPRGMGSGRDSHKEYVLDWQGVLIAFSARRKADRRLHNFLLRVTGEPCLMIGYQAAWDAAWAIIEQLGGRVVDDWVRRVDLCIDIPGLSVRDQLMPAFQANSFVTTARQWNSWDGCDGLTGFTVGSLPRLKLNVYDKVADVLKKHQGLYQRAMIDRRWFGAMPEQATRIEWQIGKEWLDQYGEFESSKVFGDLGSIVSRVAALGPDPRPFFCMTTAAPDRENGNQARSDVLPLWAKVVNTMWDWSGNPLGKLERIQRGKISCKKAWQMTVGILTGVADVWGRECLNWNGLQRVLRELYERNDCDDKAIARSWKRKARKSGTWDSIVALSGDATTKAKGASVVHPPLISSDDIKRGA
jgi:hypothetical protein